MEPKIATLRRAYFAAKDTYEMFKESGYCTSAMLRYFETEMKEAQKAYDNEIDEQIKLAGV